MLNNTQKILSGSKMSTVSRQFNVHSLNIHISYPIPCSSSIHLRFLAAIAVSIKVMVFWVVTPCSLVHRCRCFGGNHCLHLQGKLLLYPQYRGSTFLQNVGTNLPKNMASHPKRPSSQFSPVLTCKYNLSKINFNIIFHTYSS